jgi:hypothetical protein
MSFQISALPKAAFEYLFELSPTELSVHNAMRRTVTAKPGFPCRVSLADAEIGEEVILVHFEHHAASTPFRASHAVYVRPHAVQATVAPGEVPVMLRSRTLSLRGFDKAGMLVDAQLAEGSDLEAAIGEMFQNGDTAYIHAHFAKPGCYAARTDRHERR